MNNSVILIKIGIMPRIYMTPIMLISKEEEVPDKIPSGIKLNHSLRCFQKNTYKFRMEPSNRETLKTSYCYYNFQKIHTLALGTSAQLVKLYPLEW